MAFDSQIGLSSTNPGMARRSEVGMAPITGMRHLTLGDLIPDAGIVEITALVNAGKHKASDFKPVLAKYKDILAEKEVDVGYLAYALEYAVTHNAGRVP